MGSARAVAKGRQGVFRYPLPTNPTSLDPGKVQDGDTIDVCQQVFEGLVKWGEDNTVQPNLAEKVGHHRWRQDLRFSPQKGREVPQRSRGKGPPTLSGAGERVGTRDYGSSTAETYMSDIVGLKDKLAGKSKEITGAKIIDDYTFQVTIDKPRPYFLGKLTYACAFVYAKEALPDGMKDMATIDQMVGTGPFKFEKFTPEEIVVLAANKDYHGGAPALEKIERPVIKDAQSRLNKFKTGETDLVTLERADLAAIEKDPALKAQLKTFDRPSMYYVGLNTDVVPALKDRRGSASNWNGA